VIVEKILWIKTGWSDYYRGGPVDGNFGWLNAHRGTDKEARGHEAFNFMPSADGKYYCYVPPQTHGYAPCNEDNEGWTVICLAKNPRHKGVHVVGWYENATLMGKWLDLPGHTTPDGSATASPYDWSYCIESKSAFFVPPELRTSPFSDTSVRQGKYSFLTGPDVETTATKRRILALLKSKIADLRGIAIHNPTGETAPNPELDVGDPLSGFGTPEHRKRVEMAAEEAVKAHYVAQGYAWTRVAHLNNGFDFVFQKDRTVLNVEVKGTAGPIERLFLTRNEHSVSGNPQWRLAMVTDALGTPLVRVYTDKAFRKAFFLEPYVYIGRRVFEP